MTMIKITPGEYDIIQAFRELGKRENMVVTKMDGNLECKIDIHRTVFVVKDKDVVYNVDIAGETQN